MCTIQDFLAGQRSLVCFLQGMAGVCTTIELRNETTVHGTIETVDALMGAKSSTSSPSTSSASTSATSMFLTIFTWSRRFAIGCARLPTACPRTAASRSAVACPEQCSLPEPCDLKAFRSGNPLPLPGPHSPP
eukprot:m.8247 g.8247  ORF g.8247 m.8247 type:complete len:133 (-) comp2267_c0_seq2:100-498(-)